MEFKICLTYVIGVARSDGLVQACKLFLESLKLIRFDALSRPYCSRTPKN